VIPVRKRRPWVLLLVLLLAVAIAVAIAVAATAAATAASTANAAAAAGAADNFLELLLLGRAEAAADVPFLQAGTD
jgi:flagellar basal body-associated protein FliL